MAEFIELGGMINGHFRRNQIYPLERSGEAIMAFRERCSNTDAYYCTYAFDQWGREKGTRFLSPLYFDIDGDITTEDGFRHTHEALLSLLAFLSMDFRIKGREIKLYFSGGKGFHILINPGVIGMLPSMYLHMAYKAIAMQAAKKIEHGELLDTRIYDCKRLLRLPNSINAKSGLYKIPVPLQYAWSMERASLLEMAQTPKPEYPVSNERNNDAAQRIVAMLRNEKERRSRSLCINRSNIIPETEKRMPPCIRELMLTPVKEGTRNNTLVIIASALVQNGYTGSKATNALLAWNSMNEPPLPENEILLAYRSAERMAMQGRGYGCSAIREYGDFNHNTICRKCRIHQSIVERGSRNA